MTSLRGEINDPVVGVRFYISECSIESPVELDVFRDETGALRIGAVPPLYHVDTSFRPVFHKLSFRTVLGQDHDGN